jgi:hypothetical protein
MMALVRKTAQPAGGTLGNFTYRECRFEACVIEGITDIVLCRPVSYPKYMPVKKQVTVHRLISGVGLKSTVAATRSNLQTVCGTTESLLELSERLP